jgi:putative tryptophan/tyrosine transport system substrate-binding protein
MKRRAFIAGLSCVTALPLAAQAQPLQRMKRVAVLMAVREDDPEGQARVAAFVKELGQLGWSAGQNVEFQERWARADQERIQRFAKELVALNPDVILSNTTPVTAALQRETRSIPIVFVIVSDPVGDGFVTNLSHPSSNITGFINFENTMGGKWVQLLKEAAPAAAHVAAIFNPETAPGKGNYFMDPFREAAATNGLAPIILPVRSLSDIVRSMAELPAAAGLVIMPDTFVSTNRHTIISEAIHRKIPVISARTGDAREGALLGYGTEYLDIFRRAAGYVDRILRGENPRSLPVQVPARFELVINLKTAKALGITVSPTLLARADEVIE